jgi:hypothetical protein
VKGVAAALPVLAVPSSAHAQTPLDATLLQAVAETVLPSELGADGITQATHTFQAWLAAYEPVAERSHGYGTAELDYLPPDPAPGWSAQLQALDLEAQRRHGSGFTAIDMAARRTILLRHMSTERGERLPDPLEARHVAAGLLAWWCASPAAADLCQRARVAKQSCRPLANTAQRPATLDRSS